MFYGTKSMSDGIFIAGGNIEQFISSSIIKKRGFIMRWGTVVLSDGTRTAAFLRDGEAVSVAAINSQCGKRYPLDLESVIAEDLDREVAAAGKNVPGELAGQVTVAAPLSRPERIVGIGLNYQAHARDLGEHVPQEPATFLKPLNTLIGPGDPIEIPVMSERTTAEAEIALVFGRGCRDVPSASWRQVIFGVVPVLDMTTEDILRKNPRFLTRAKGYDSFFSFGPWIVTLDELSDLSSIVVETLVNGEVQARSPVSGMTYGPGDLVAFITAGVTVGATAVLSTGTPGAAVIHPGDVAEARVSSVGMLSNPVAERR